jgi:hypothetical protein
VRNYEFDLGTILVLPDDVLEPISVEIVLVAVDCVRPQVQRGDRANGRSDILSVSEWSTDGYSVTLIERNYLRCGRLWFLRRFRSSRPSRSCRSGGRRRRHCRGCSGTRWTPQCRRPPVWLRFYIQFRYSSRHLQNRAWLQSIRWFQVVESDDFGLRDPKCVRNNIQGLATLYNNIHFVFRRGRSGGGCRRKRRLTVRASSHNQAVADHCCRT